MASAINSPAKRPGKVLGKRVTKEGSVSVQGHWNVSFGELEEPKRKPGRPPLRTEPARLFQVVGEKLPFSCLDDVRRHVIAQGVAKPMGVYVAHDSMGCSRYIGRGDIFNRLAARKKKQALELEYFSFYIVESKNHEREIETLLIRAAGFLLEFNDRKKRVGIKAGNVKDYEAGTRFYQRRYIKPSKA